MLSVFRKRIDLLKCFVIFILILMLLLPVGCAAWFAYSLYYPETSPQDSSVTFQERSKALAAHFGKDAVRLGDIIESSDITLDAAVEIDGILFEINMTNCDNKERYEILFETPAADSPQAALPNDEALANFAEIVDILSEGEYSKQYMSEHFNDSISDLKSELLDPEYLKKKAETEYRFVRYDYNFAGRESNGYDFDIRMTDGGVYSTNVFIAFACFK